MADTPAKTSTPSVRVSVLPTGYLYLPDDWIFAEGDPSLKHLTPDYSFLIQHPSGRNVLFDLGLRKNLETYPPAIRNEYDILEPYAPLDAHDLLSTGPISPSSISQIILSHLHFDHVGDITRFPDADILLGPGSLSAARPGFPASDSSPFDGSILTHPRVSEFARSRYTRLSPDSVPGDFPFGDGVDVFGDASFLILDAPGHMGGHQMGLARTGADEWVVMGGDCCHHRGLLEDGSRDIGTSTGPSGQPGFHKFPADARATIAKTRALHSAEDVLVVLAHDASLEGCVPFYPQDLNGWRKQGLKRVRREGVLGMEEVKERMGRVAGVSVQR